MVEEAQPHPVASPARMPRSNAPATGAAAASTTARAGSRRGAGARRWIPLVRLAPRRAAPIEVAEADRRLGVAALGAAGEVVRRAREDRADGPAARRRSARARRTPTAACRSRASPGRGARASARSIAGAARCTAASSGGGSPLPHPAAAPSAARASRAAIRRGMGGIATTARYRDRVRRSAYDREIVRLALPALGALAAEPLYLLADTAIVGHLGTPQLAALALAATAVLASSRCASSSPTGRPRTWRGCTARAQDAGGGRARRAGAVAGARDRGAADGRRASRSRRPLIDAARRRGDVAATWRRATCGSRALGVAVRAGRARRPGLAARRRRPAHAARDPRRRQRRRTSCSRCCSSTASTGASTGSAWGTVIAQAGMGSRSSRVLLRAPADAARPDRERIRSLVSIGGASSFVRTAALLGCFLARERDLRAHRRRRRSARTRSRFQLFVFLALVLDAIAIAGQVIVGRALGAGDAEARVRRGAADDRAGRSASAVLSAASCSR